MNEPVNPDSPEFQQVLLMLACFFLGWMTAAIAYAR